MFTIVPIGTKKDGSSWKECNDPVQKFMCTKCGKLLASQSSLSKHMQSHTGEYNYYCNACRKGFANFGHYKDHMNRHEGVRYQCEVCSRFFTGQRVYCAHMASHTGVQV